MLEERGIYMRKEEKLNMIFDNLANGLNITQTMMEKAETAYHALGEHIKNTNEEWDVTIYPQGSFQLGTVIKPVNDEEQYDVDLVVLVKAPHYNAESLRNEVIQVLESHGRYEEQVRLLQEMPSEENLWQAVIAFQDYPFKTATGLPFRYKLKVGKNGEYNRELLIDRREKSKSLAWSSVVLAFENSKKVSEEVKKPKALGDIRGVSYIYPILWRLGLIRVPEEIEKKMGKQR